LPDGQDNSTQKATLLNDYIFHMISYGLMRNAVVTWIAVESVPTSLHKTGGAKEFLAFLKKFGNPDAPKKSDDALWCEYSTKSHLSKRKTDETHSVSVLTCLEEVAEQVQQALIEERAAKTETTGSGGEGKTEEEYFREAFERVLECLFTRDKKPALFDRMVEEGIKIYGEEQVKRDDGRVRRPVTQADVADARNELRKNTHPASSRSR
jgi:hypothetical protein